MISRIQLHQKPSFIAFVINKSLGWKMCNIPCYSIDNSHRIPYPQFPMFTKIDSLIGFVSFNKCTRWLISEPVLFVHLYVDWILDSSGISKALKQRRRDETCNHRTTFPFYLSIRNHCGLLEEGAWKIIGSFFPLIKVDWVFNWH